MKWYWEGHGLNVEKCVESLKSVIKINGACFNNMGKLNVCLFKVDLLITLCIYITSYSINACCMWLITNYNQHNIYHTNFNTTLKEDNWYRFCMIILRCKRRPRWHWTIHCVRHYFCVWCPLLPRFRTWRSRTSPAAGTMAWPSAPWSTTSTPSPLTSAPWTPRRGDTTLP